MARICDFSGFSSDKHQSYQSQLTDFASVTMDKRQIRSLVRIKIATLSTEHRLGASRQIFSAVASLPQFAEARVVALYAALPDEPQTREFIQAWSSEKRIVLPRVEGEIMHFYDYTPEQMQIGSFGISEPQGDTPCHPEDIELIIIPGVAFTIDGKRLGRGKGFYDRYLAQNDFRAFKVGVCFKEQIINDIPIDTHDQQADIVCTD